MFTSQKYLTLLEFDKITAMLADCASTEGAKSAAAMLTPSHDPDTVAARQTRTTDARRLLESKGHPPFGGAALIGEGYLGDLCGRAEKGAPLSPRELLDAAAMLRVARLLSDYIKADRTFETVLDEVFGRLLPNRTLEESIRRAIISEDMIADEASAELADIRRKMRAVNNKVKDILQKYIGGQYSKYLQENIITMRNSRYVIPVRAECKADVKGLIHDTSSSGATIFVEPMPVVEANNELRILASREEHEIERILAELSAGVAETADNLMYNFRNITDLAFAFACAELSSRMRAEPPRIRGDRAVELIAARHPLIDRAKVVPVDIRIGGGYDTVIITGPNTGGKTVTLKTLGLLACMTQAGLHIPAGASSSLCVFDEVLADIGDEQSIEQSLSTFSSHMVNIVAILERVGSRSLVLFDELGVGTDPVEGAALAVSVIETVRAAGAICAATTHYSELKAYALENAGVRNASCEFNIETLRPTYKLIIGTPGRSNAFAISARLGLGEAVIERAKTLINNDNKKFEDIIEKLEASRIEMERHKAAAAAGRAEFERFREESERGIKMRLAEAERETERAKNKARQLVEGARASSDYILAQLDEVRRKRESEDLARSLDNARRNIRANLRENADSLDPVEDAPPSDYVPPRPFRKGDEVLLVNINKRGVLLEDPAGDDAAVQAGIIKTRTSLDNLRLIEDEPGAVIGGKRQRAADYRVSASRDFRPEIDLRGQVGEDAIMDVDKYLDEARMAGIKKVTLIHGKGTGALRNAIWKYLRSDKRVSDFRAGQYGEGDYGVTVVELK